MFIGFHIAMDKLNFFELEIQLFLKQILQKSNSIDQSVCLLTFSIN